jgi:hypothetical protein
LDYDVISVKQITTQMPLTWRLLVTMVHSKKSQRVFALITFRNIVIRVETNKN